MPSLKGKSRNLVFKQVRIKALVFSPFHIHTSHLSHRPHRFEDPSLSSAFLPLIVEAGVCLTTHDTGRELDVQLVLLSFNSQSSRSHSCYRPRLQRDCASIPSFRDSLTWSGLFLVASIPIGLLSTFLDILYRLSAYFLVSKMTFFGGGVFSLSVFWVQAVTKLFYYIKVLQKDVFTFLFPYI